MAEYKYPEIPDFQRKIEALTEYARLQHEYGATGIEELLSGLEASFDKTLASLKSLPVDEALAKEEPDDLKEIQALRPKGARRQWTSLPKSYDSKLKGAFMARMAGCTLGAIVEFWSIEAMEKWAAEIGDAFPPVDYWSRIKNENDLRYGKSKNIEYTRDVLNGVPVDDDVTYTQLGLLIAEDYGIDFTVEDVGKAWLKYLPYACTAEDIALQNLKKGVAAKDVADINNPYCQWIGADIRSDPWAYIAPGYPEKAAAMAYHDAYISHRRNGIYGEMFFAAAQSAAFVVDDPIEAMRMGLSEIPRDCLLTRDMQWALNEMKNIHNYRQAREAVDTYFKGMSGVHTNNNAALVLFGLNIGGLDVTRVLSEIVAMGLDNDCTAATAGSIVGAIVGIDGVPAHWYKNFNNKCLSYIIGHDAFAIDDLLHRFKAQAMKVHGAL